MPLVTQTFPHHVNSDMMSGYIMLLMTREKMTGIHVTLDNLATMTDKMFSSSYITAAKDVIALAAADDLLLQSTQSLSSVAAGSNPLGHQEDISLLFFFHVTLPSSCLII